MAELGSLYRRNITVIGIPATFSYWLYKYMKKVISLTSSS